MFPMMSFGCFPMRYTNMTAGEMYFNGLTSMLPYMIPSITPFKVSNCTNIPDVYHYKDDGTLHNSIFFKDKLTKYNGSTDNLVNLTSESITYNTNTDCNCNTNINNNSEYSLNKPATTKLNTGLAQLDNINYDTQKGKLLTQDILGHIENKSTGWCAKYVKNSLARTGLGNYEKGDAYQCADILAHNSNFKEINVKGNDLKSLPEGCIIVYNRNQNSKYGHIEVSLGNGEAASDFRGKINPSNDVRVFAPVAS